MTSASTRILSLEFGHVAVIYAVILDDQAKPLFDVILIDVLDTGRVNKKSVTSNKEAIILQTHFIHLAHLVATTIPT